MKSGVSSVTARRYIMKNISSELEFNNKQSFENHENGLLSYENMGRPELNSVNESINGISNSPNNKDYLLNKSPLLLSSSETLNSCEQPLLPLVSPVPPNYLSSWPDKLNLPCDRRSDIDKRYWRAKDTSRSLHECEKPCMSDRSNGAEARGMVRSASLLEICESRSGKCQYHCKASDARCDFPNVADKRLESNADDPDTSISNHVEGEVCEDGLISCLEQRDLGDIGCSFLKTTNKWLQSSDNDTNVGISESCCCCDVANLGVRCTNMPNAEHTDCSNGPVSLDAVLDSIPIAYNPRTKQLHIISVNPSPQQLDSGSTLDDLGWAIGGGESSAKNPSSPNAKNDLGPGSEPQRSGTLQRVSTCDSSISSISSLSTEFSVSTASAFEEGGLILDSDEAGFIEINLDRHSNRSERNPTLLDCQLMDEECAAIQGAKPKRRGLSSFLSRSLLPWKTSREANIPDTTAAGWKLFGKAAPRHSATRDPNKIIEEYHARQRHQATFPTDSTVTPKHRRSEELIASSTTALILENRPAHLPAKDPEEEIKHRVQYEQMVEAAKKKELKEAKLKKKLLQQQLRHEEQLSQASKIWNTDILPSWDTMRSSRRAKELWWQGIPPSVRGKVWKLAIGNDLHITPELYEICVCRAKDRIRMAAELISVSEDDPEESDKEGSVQLIKLDVSRTFPQFCIFQKGGPYYDMLHSLLGAYVCYRPDVGYVQGMSFLAAVLILNLDIADAFICFANLLNQPCQLAFFRLDEPMMRSYFLTYEEFFKENMPKLFNHFTRQNLSPDLYLIDWIYTVYSRSLPLDVASRVWDVFFRDGDELLFRTALGILKLYEDILLNLDFIHLAQFLTKLPEDIAAEPLFRSIECIRMVTDKRSFAQVLLGHAEPKQT